MLYKNEDGIEHDVYVIHAVEERDHHTITLTIDRPVSNNKHIISREAHNALQPKPKDYLSFAPGNTSIIRAADVALLGTPVIKEPSLETPTDEIKVTSGIDIPKVTVSEKPKKKAKTEATKSSLPSDAGTESETEE